MGFLAKFLQQQFVSQSPFGWRGSLEQRVLGEEFERLIGYSPRADVCLEHTETKQRLWIEFEISRADPVANHAKFATAHLFQPFSHSDSFVSMVSSHVARGRRNLASNTIHLLRHVGISAFQTVLLPHLEPGTIKRLNHSSIEELNNARLDVPSELERVFQISQPAIVRDHYRIHFASELFDVVRNLHRWNAQVASPEGAAFWKRRTVSYFVFDPISRDFAPSKFCAYVIPVTATERASEGSLNSGLMDLQTYCKLDESDPRFDGQIARLHLERQLGMIVIPAPESNAIDRAFKEWLDRHHAMINVHPSGAKVLMPPKWYGEGKA